MKRLTDIVRLNVSRCGPKPESLFSHTYYIYYTNIIHVEMYITAVMCKLRVL